MAGPVTKVIVNPAANHGKTAELIPAVRQAALLWNNAEVIVTDHYGQATELAAAFGQIDTVVIVGGDGSVFEVVNGLARSSNLGVTIGIIPAGSGNDFAKALGLPRDFAAAVDVVTRGATSPVDLGTVNGRVFVNSLAIGFDARVAHLANEIKDETRRTGIMLYLTALFRIMFGDYYCHDVRLHFDDGDWLEKKLLLVAVNNGATYGGGFRITPDAVNDDGFLDVCVIDALPRWQVFWRLPFAIAGRHKWMKQASFYRVKTVDIESERPLPAALDGELILDKTFRIEVDPGALTVIKPNTEV
jgi:diacylglycerol kinase (ATP)